MIILEGVGKRICEILLQSNIWYIKWIVFTLALIGLLKVIKSAIAVTLNVLALCNKFKRKVIQMYRDRKKSNKNSVPETSDRKEAYITKFFNQIFEILDSLAEMAKRSPDNGIKRTMCGDHLRSPDDLVDWPQFPEGCKSLLSKHLTREVWEKYKNQTDEWGISFKSCIFSGCKNVDSGIGVYAGSYDSYRKFGELFDPIIEEYHQHSEDAQHVSNMNASALYAPPLPRDEAQMIVSTRIRVGRNLAEFPLGPGINKGQRDTIMDKVVQACSKFEGDLAGKFYSLSSLSEQDRRQLVEDHFLFKEGDRFLEACGLNRDWPSGRGIFHNKDKTFLVWVNEEDQLRIISMQPGADIAAVFDRLSRAAAAIEKVAKFAHNDHLGYITSCPTNLGTALRGSVHIRLPKLGEKKQMFKSIADRYYVQIRGIHGEHSESNDGVYDISNKRRLGRSEKDLVQDMYNGVKAMIQAEKSL